MGAGGGSTKSSNSSSSSTPASNVASTGTSGMEEAGGLGERTAGAGVGRGGETTCQRIEDITTSERLDDETLNQIAGWII